MKSCWNWPLLKPMSLDNRSDVLTVSLHLHFKSVSHSEASQSVKGRRRFPPIFPQPEIICTCSKTFLTFEVRRRVGWSAWSGSSVLYGSIVVSSHAPFLQIPLLCPVAMRPCVMDAASYDLGSDLLENWGRVNKIKPSGSGNRCK